MSPSTRRFLLALIAWPAGIVGTVLYVLLGATSTPCDPNGPCSVSLDVASTNEIIQFLTFAFGPGIIATWYWWKNRPRTPDAGRDSRSAP